MNKDRFGECCYDDWCHLLWAVARWADDVDQDEDETVEMLDDEFTLDLLVEKMSFIERVQEGIEESINGETISDEEFEKQVNLWFK